MILSCPHCETRYDVDLAPGPWGPLRCRRCQSTFRPNGTGKGNNHQGRPGREESPAIPSPSGNALVASEPGRFRDLLCRCLREQAVPVKVTADGEHALELFRREMPRYLFASVYLRRMLGITLCERIREIREGAGSRVALMGYPLGRDSSAPSPESLYGADLYLEETLSTETLDEKVRAFLAEDGLEASAAIGLPSPGVEDEGPEQEEGTAEDTEFEIRKLGRIAADDLLLYHPSKVASCLDSEEAEEAFRVEIGQGKVLAQERFPDVPNAGEIFLHSLMENLMRTAADRGP